MRPTDFRCAMKNGLRLTGIFLLAAAVLMGGFIVYRLSGGKWVEGLMAARREQEFRIASDFVRAIHLAETDFHARSGRYTVSFVELQRAGLLDSVQDPSVQSGYVFFLSQNNDCGYQVTARPAGSDNSNFSIHDSQGCGRGWLGQLPYVDPPAFEPRRPQYAVKGR